MKRRASANWQGTGLEGQGSMTTQSGVFQAQPYSYLTRFKDEEGKSGTNPEELIAAAHAGCFTMALSFTMSKEGFVAEDIQTEAVLEMEMSPAITITRITLKTKAKVPNLSAEQFQTFAQAAKQNCPVSKVLNAEIVLEAELV
jgi:osmotically inducible protein OsmC